MVVKLSDYSYELPEDRIADRPPAVRGASRLLVLDKKTGTTEDGYYKNLADYLHEGDVLVLNNTKVLPARLIVHTEQGAERELLLLEKHGREADVHHMHVMYRRRLKVGQMLRVHNAVVRVDEIFGNGTARISSDQDIWKLAEQYGSMPLPPYMHRQADKSDTERYQTVFAKEKGSVAAPTASLNMTDETLAAIKCKGVKVHELTLHVGLGTFMPIRSEDITAHHMHQEYFEIPAATVQAIRAAKQEGRRVVVVGTTVTRTLEYAAKEIMDDRTSGDIAGEADIFIYPGYEFKIVDAMVTNFHAPHSTVLMMAAAFAGWGHLRAAYEHAVEARYNFLSYGDSMLIR